MGSLFLTGELLRNHGIRTELIQTDGILEYAEALRKNAEKNGQICTTSDTSTDLIQYGLDLLDCKSCHNTGYLTRIDEKGYLWTRECSCMAKRRSIRQLKRSGLENAVSHYTFEKYQTPDVKRETIKQKAVDYCCQSDAWFFISGRSGSGKTHICTAIFGSLIDQGKEARFMRWRDESQILKAAVNQPEEYSSIFKPLKNAEVLYIDDFLQGDITEADIKLAFNLIDARYNNHHLQTIISTERSLPDILSVSEAVGGRIAERSKGFIIESPSENWRLRR